MRGIVMSCVLKFACIESELGTEDSHSEQCMVAKGAFHHISVHMHVTWLTRMADMSILLLGTTYHVNLAMPPFHEVIFTLPCAFLCLLHFLASLLALDLPLRLLADALLGMVYIDLLLLLLHGHPNEINQSPLHVYRG
jgi:hypothetical protein